MLLHTMHDAAMHWHRIALNWGVAGLRCAAEVLVRQRGGVGAMTAKHETVKWFFNKQTADSTRDL